MTQKKNKSILIALPLVLLASGLAIAFVPGIEIPDIHPVNNIIQMETTDTINLASGPVKVEAKTLKAEWFLNWELAEERETVSINKVDSLANRVEVKANQYFEPVELVVYTVDLSTRYSVILTWDEVGQSILLDETNITF